MGLNAVGFITLLIIVVNIVFAYELYDDDGDYREYLEFVASENERGLFPSIFNLATNARVSVNATCGQEGPESYCKLVEHVFNVSPQCDICDENNPAKRHPIQYAVDGSEKWWQSPSIDNGIQYEQVTITIDLRQHYQVAYVIVKAAISPRPGNWILERSLDNATWLPWQYFATHDAECQREFGVPATRGTPKFVTDDQVICTSHFSRLMKLEHGEIHTSLVNGRPGVDGPSLELQTFTKARYVRLRLLKLRTLNADLMIINRRDNSYMDPSVTRRYFYSIKDISIGGQCICYGHAESCPIDPITGQLKCECRHNTCGESCNTCCPLFNQLPWEHGTNQEPHICQPCQCFSHADRCEYDAETERLGLSVTPDGIYQGGGVCQGCKHNTQGVNCEECSDKYYRPAGISHYREDACRPCDCDTTGSIDGSCIKDETRATVDTKAGDCLCKPGFGGRRCDRCAQGYRNYPTCEPCPCNKAGSANYATCESTCRCKRNVEGVYCDRCKPGFIGMDERNPDGCQPCFCFGLSEQCTQLHWPLEKVRVMSGWNLTDLDGRLDVVHKQENQHSLTFNSKQVDQYGIYYWKAPKQLKDNLLTSYGSYLQYYVYFVPEEEGPPTPLADVKISGNGVEVEYHSRQEFYERENVSVQVRLHESSGWYDSKTRRPISKELLMKALANVQMFLIRAKYHHRQIQSSLYGVSLEKASESAISDSKPVNVEQCTCPTNFAGLSCESCVSGFRRVGNQLLQGKCEQCSCNEHSSDCDPYSGHCLECQHNTTGPRCELCLTGYFGNPSLGGEDGACRECACPLTTPENKFSDTCMLSPYGGPNEYVCTACQPGYGGNHCESCVDGYFGEPMTINGSCALCQCNENIDPVGVDNCDRVTGMCKKCIYNTEGDHCEKCKPEHYGSALRHDCKACNCHLYGSKVRQCDNDTGMCECNEFYIGRQCDRCEAGHGDIENGCPQCACDAVGAIGEWCDPESGQCQCKPGIFGKRCDTCQSGYFGFSDTGCQYCGCNDSGSEQDRKCDMETGQCICKAKVIGQKCSECEDGSFNITSGEGCQSCDCHPDGAEGQRCHFQSGQCRCKPGVTGVKCDECAPNYYGLSASGCTECQVCPALGQVCDSVTGECVCPENTEGKMCEKCSENTWNYDPLKGCQPCQCDGVGSADGSCDLETGQCTCQEKYTGRMCDTCTHGHYDFPDCLKCKCHKAGTNPSACKIGLGCSCDEEGQCPCKSNVHGEKCRECDPMSFSLEEDNPNGCTKCFCFNRTNFCVQSSHVWQQIYAENRIAFFTEPYQPYNQVHGLRVIPAQPNTLNVYPTDWTPLYWSMPKKFLDDKITSYNGFLRFRATNENENYLQGSVMPEERFFRYYPLVVLVGNHRSILEYYPKEPIPDDGRYRVKFREDLWKSRVTPDIAVTRENLMIALQNLQALYVRGTFSYRPGAASIDDVSINVAVWNNITTEGGLNTAIGVEACGDCPRGYSGTSCQNPAEGYFRQRKPDFLNSADDLDLVGTAEPCACHGHSITCHPETGRCTGCLHNTTGDFCERCETGFYGDATDGVPTACTQCACPTIENSFSSTCYKVSYDKGYVCGACPAGYQGNYCQECAEGYYGDPTVQGGSCKACNCHRDGSISSICDPATGQCQCRPELTGRDCSECQARHALIGARCTSCDVGCTLELMQVVDGVVGDMASYNFTGLIPAPWKGLNRIGNLTDELNSKLDDVVIGQAEAKVLLEDMKHEEKFLEEAKGVADVAKFRLSKINDTMNTLDEMAENTENFEIEIRESLKNAEDVFQLLRQYSSVGFSPRSPVDLTNWLNEATNHIESMNKRSEHLEKRFNRAEMDLKEARNLLTRVQGQKLNDTSFEVLHDRLETLSDNIENMRDILWDDVRKPITSAQSINTINKKTIERYNIANGQSEALANEFEDNLQTARDDAAGATSALLQIHDHYMGINDTTLDSVRNATDLCHQHTTAVNNLLTARYGSDEDYAKKYVEAAVQHRRQLQYDANRVKSSAQPAKYESEQAVKASTAYNQIVEGLKNASDAAESARSTADNTFNQIFEPDPSLPKSAEASENISQKLVEESTTLSSEDQEQRLKLKSLEAELGDLNDQLIRSTKVLTDGARFERFDTLNNEIELGSQQADIAQKAAAAIRQKVDNLGSKITNMADQAKRVSKFSGEGFDALTKDVDESNRKIVEAADHLKAVKLQAESNEKKVDGLANRLTLLKEKIKEAREKASKIRISVKSNDQASCTRAYMSPAHPTPTNIIHIKYIPLEQVPDSLIFITKTQRTRTQPAEYLTLELKDQRFRFHWNVGGGQEEDQTITNEKTIYSVNQGDRNTWYHIDIERMGNRAKLTVSLVKTTVSETLPLDEPITVEHGEEGEFAVFNTDPGKTTIDLGVGDGDKPDPLSASQFKGSIGEIMIDGRKIPLWNFVKDSPSHCAGADKPINTVPGGFMFRDGYAQIDAAFERQQSTTGFKFIIRFAAYSPNGLLYFRGNPSDQDFMALELKDGHIVLQFNLGSGSELRIESKQAYNDGKVHSVTAIRNSNNATLVVNPGTPKEDFVNGLAPGTNTGLNLPSQSDHYVGGVPSSFNTSSFDRFNIEWSGFYGCIREINPGSRRLNLEEAIKFLNYEAGCYMKDDRLQTLDRVIHFSTSYDTNERSFFVVSGVQMTDSSSFGFGFRTHDGNATLVYQSSTLTTYRRRVREIRSQGFIAAYLYNGKLTVHMGVDASDRSKVVTLTSNDRLDDGRLHSVLLIRDGSSVTLSVDDAPAAKDGVLEDRSPIGSPRAQMFLGGLPARLLPSSQEVSGIFPFEGCISDLYINYERVPLVPEEHSNCLIGVCRLPNVPNIAEEPLQADSGDNDILSDQANQPISLPQTAFLHTLPHSGSPEAALERQPLSTLSSPVLCAAPMQSISTPDAVQFGLQPFSYVQVSIKDVMQKKYPIEKHGSTWRKKSTSENFSVGLSFRTRSSNGVLWLWANNKLKQIMSLDLMDGQLKFHMIKTSKGGERNKRCFLLSEFGKTFDDYKWHQVLFTKKGPEISLTIDGETTNEKGCPNQINILRRRFFVGGIRETAAKNMNHSVPSLVGCIGNFTFNDIPVDLYSTVFRRQDVYQCFVRTDDNIVHANNGFIHMIPETKPDQLYVQFRTSSPSGRIMTLVDSDNVGKNFLDVTLREGQMYATLHLSGLNVASTVVSVSVPFCDGQWHTLKVQVSKSKMTLQVDDMTSHSSIVGVDKLKLMGMHLYVAGVKDVDVLSAVETSFVGCLRNLKISDKLESWSAAKESFRVVTGMCPYSN